MSNDVVVSQCLIWTRALRNGYGHRNINGKSFYVHRMICLAAYGPAPADKPLALHRCNNRACYNPDHLYWGSKRDNTEDSRKAGTMAIGEKHGRAKITGDDVLAIRADKRSSYKVATDYGLAASTIRSIRNSNGNWR